MNIRSILPISLPLIIFLLCLCSSKPEDDYDLSSIFTQDSDYIDKKGLLLIFPEIDTVNFEGFESNNYGKYFKDATTGDYIAAVYNPNGERYSSTQLISVDVLNNKIINGRFLSSWYYGTEFQIESFRKIYGYYYLSTNLGNGIGYNASGFYLFKDINDVRSPIYEGIYSGGINMEYKTLGMTDLMLAQDTLKIKYAVDSGVFEEINDDYIPKVVSSKEWTIDYYRTKDDWVATDSTLFETEEMLFM